MIKKRYLYITACILVVFIIIAFSAKTVTSAREGMLQVESIPLHNTSGWGYDILVDHKIFIHQEAIPAIAGKKGFLTKDDAMKTAALIIDKLVKGKQPAITKDDLTALKISFP